MNVELHPSLSSSRASARQSCPLLVLFSPILWRILNFDLDIQFIDKFT
mgnify:CR=1 FL=1